ncbi:FCD domain-containing protein [Mesorhizobium sp. M0400]|uniref:FCD domain-containing protein n=1 Tax=Mesorhizobium sp. M0400 TaxID=2956941 RepID=UPI00333BB9D4
MSPANLDMLREKHALFTEADRAKRWREAIVHNREFHFAGYQLSGMDMLVGHIESLWVSMGPILNVFYSEIVNDYVAAEEHIHLIHALARKDGEGPRVAIERDLLRSGDSIIRFLSTQAK